MNMRELSLFSGAGGGLLASKLLGWRTVGYVEFNDYCQRVIAARIRDGYLDDAPIFGDIRSFNDQGYARSYRGMVDVVSGGFPCQPFSVAGKQAAADDPRNMWPETRETLRLVRPRYAFLENVPGLINGAHGYFGVILGDLAALGYDVRWTVLSAADCGAPHLRKRLWIVADSGSVKRDAGRSVGVCPKDDGTKGTSRGASVGCQDWQRSDMGQEINPVPYTGWNHPPVHDGGFDDVANQLDRLRAIGNGQVPIVAATAWRLLTGDIG